MKVLTTPAGSVLVFDPNGGAAFAALTDGTIHAKGIVAEMDDLPVAQQGADALKAVREAQKAAEQAQGPNAVGIPFGTGGMFAFTERNDITRDLRFITSCITDVTNGTEVGVIAKGQRLSLDIPQSAKPNYQKGLAKGVTVAVGPLVTPKAMMNARGVVVAVNGAKASVQFDDGDLDRIRRATGKNFANPVKMHKGTLEVIA